MSKSPVSKLGTNEIRIAYLQLSEAFLHPTPVRVEWFETLEGHEGGISQLLLLFKEQINPIRIQ